MFAADPDRYAPYYSGYCASSVAYGKKYEADPEAWTISDGKLFLFLDKRALREFTGDSARIISKADANWPALKDRNY
jgi:hypothetical protein